MSNDKQSSPCCDELDNVINSEEVTPLIHRDETGVLYMSVGCVQLDENEDDDDGNNLGWLDAAVFYCPFCGTQLQTAEEVDEKETS